MDPCTLCLCLRQARFHGEISALVPAFMLAFVLASRVKTSLYNDFQGNVGRNNSIVRAYKSFLGSLESFRTLVGCQIPSVP